MADPLFIHLPDNLYCQIHSRFQIRFGAEIIMSMHIAAGNAQNKYGNRLVGQADLSCIGASPRRTVS